MHQVRDLRKKMTAQKKQLLFSTVALYDETLS